MPISKKRFLSKLTLFAAIACVLFYFASLQFASSAFYGPDSYYHIALSGFIKEFGAHYSFQWFKFSLFADSFSDKDFLFHVLCTPFLYIVKDMIAAGKCAVVFYDFLFLVAFAFILKRYLNDFLAAAFLFLPVLSSVFSMYFLQLRSVILSNIFIIFGIYFLINKKFLRLFILSLFFPLAHISFYVIIVFAVISETLRFAINKEFSAKNICIVLLGGTAGCLAHPNFPNNLLITYINGILVPFYAARGVDLGFAGELMPFDTKFALISNFAVFFTLNIVLWAALSAKRRMSFATSVWLASANLYLIFAFFGVRYWYQVNILFFVFFASYLNDWFDGKKTAEITPRGKRLIVLYLAIILIFIGPNLRQLRKFMKFSSTRNTYFENAARWMNGHIPKNKTIYHSYWADSSYFICLNPKNNYINGLDPIYMFYRYPKEFSLMRNLSMARVGNPHEALAKIFKAEYGYLRKDEPFYRQIKNSPEYFRILYEDTEGAVFKLLKQTGNAI